MILAIGSVVLSQRFRYFPKIFDDETLYSVAVRYAKHTGLRGSENISSELFGIWINKDTTAIPNGLSHLSARLGPSSKFTTDYLINNHTLFQFYFKLSGQCYRSSAARKLYAENDTKRAVFVKDINVIRRGRSLAFCPQCHNDMRQQHFELFWRRTHQLPLAFFCDIHGTPLRQSKVVSTHYLTMDNVANDETCPDNALIMAEAPSQLMNERLRALSINSIKILQNPAAVITGEALRQSYLDQLWAKGFARGGRQLDRELIKSKFADYLRSFDCLEQSYFNESIYRTKWALALLHPALANVPVNRHLLFQDFLDCTPSTRPVLRSAKARYRAADKIAKINFECGNPALKKHAGRTKILKAAHSRGRVSAKIGCECGYIYHVIWYPDGTLKNRQLYSFGPSLEKYLNDAIGAGWSLAKICRKLKMDERVIRNQARNLGIYHLIEKAG